MALAAVAITRGILMAGDCRDGPYRADTDAYCSGHPDSTDLGEGLGIVAAGSALSLVGMAMEESESKKRRHTASVFGRASPPPAAPPIGDYSVDGSR
jgi:hypothetical protein